MPQPAKETMSAPQQLIAEFIAKWGHGGAARHLNEEQGAQQHFIELCAMLGVSARRAAKTTCSRKACSHSASAAAR